MAGLICRKVKKMGLRKDKQGLWKFVNGKLIQNTTQCETSFHDLDMVRLDVIRSCSSSCNPGGGLVGLPRAISISVDM